MARRAASQEGPAGEIDGRITDVSANPVRPYQRPLDPDIFNLSQDCIKIIGRDGKLRYMNRAGCIALQVDEAHVEGVPWVGLLPELVQEVGVKALHDAGEGRVARFLGISDGGDEGRRYWDNLLTPLRGPSGQVEEILCVSRDVTEQREQDGRWRTILSELNRRSWEMIVELRGAGDNDTNSHGGHTLDDLERLLLPVEGQPKGPPKHGEAHAEEGGHAPPNPLTDKERECLFWVAVGKTAWETAKILSCSPRTVEFHLRNAARKLDASNKVHAAMIAFSRRLF